METKIEQTEKVKFTMGMSKKYSYEIVLLGRPEDNVERVKDLKKKFDDISEQMKGGDD